MAVDLEIVDLGGVIVDPGEYPAPSPESLPYRDGLARGALVLPRCGNCQRIRVEYTPVCPWCADAHYDPSEVDGAGQVFSWVTYHRAYSHHLDAVIPYSVLCVALDAGPRMFGRLLDAVSPAIGMPVHAAVERWSDGRHVLVFTSRTGREQ
jgi:uncharacterized OB-fold protein